MVKSDSIVETHHFRRVVRLEKKSLVLETKKYDDPKGGRTRYKFNVNTISVFWPQGEPPEYVVAYGTAVKDPKLNCRRRYEIDNLPDEIREILGDDLCGTRKEPNHG